MAGLDTFKGSTKRPIILSLYYYIRNVFVCFTDATQRLVNTSSSLKIERLDIIVIIMLRAPLFDVIDLSLFSLHPVSPGFVPFGVNLTHFGAKPTIPARPLLASEGYHTGI